MKWWSLLALVALWAPAAGAQQQWVVPPESTLAGRTIVIVDPGLSLGKALLIIPEYREGELLFMDRAFPSLHSSSAFPPPFLQGATRAQIDLLAPLRLQMQSEQELSTLNTILGAVGFSGALYVAYRHVKKYGF